MRALTLPVLCSLAALPLLAAVSVVALLTMPGASAVARYAVVMPLAYLIGALPWGYILLHLRRGIDIRDYGSGRTGVSNTLRTGGIRVAGLVLLLDLTKGILAVLMARALVGDPTAEVAAGLLALVGHNWPVFLGFRGGRGIAPGLGALVIMAPIAAAIGVLVFIPICLISRYLSLGSILGAVTACAALPALALLGLSQNTYMIYGLLGGAVIIWQHRDNIQRIREGTERRIGNPATRIQ